MDQIAIAVTDTHTGGGGESSCGTAYLPEECIASILSFTTPRDACRSSLVSTMFKSAADSDAVWERFLPPEYKTLMSLLPPADSFSCSSMKELYLGLSGYVPILIENGRKSFLLERPSGKVCYMLSARDLAIVWSNLSCSFWRWISLPDSRFPEVARLNAVWWLEISGTISSQMLSPETLYTAYLVYKLTPEAVGFDCQAVEVSVGLVGSESCKRSVYLDDSKRGNPAGEDDPQYQQPYERADGWLEVELGEYFNKGYAGGELEISVLEIERGHQKRGLIVHGIDLRPKQS